MMVVHAVAMLLVGLITYMATGHEFAPVIRPHEQLRAALLMAFFLPVFG